jgi:AcrR family transcriptional regulator
LYAAFSSKDVLFDAVVQRYASGFGRSVDPAADENLSPREAIEETLRQSVRMQTDPSHPSGCLVTLSEVTCVPENQRVRDLLADRRMWTLRCMTECVERAVTLGELPADTDPAALATAFHGFLMGISTQARDGVSQAALDAAVTQVMRLWDSMTVPTAPDSAIRMKPSRNEVKASS